MSATVGAAPSVETKSSKKIQTLLIARGFAAMIVVMHHAGNIAAEDRFFGQDAFGGILSRFTGVGFFFVLSGFFIGWISWKLIGDSKAAGGFWLKRMGRIYPCYWLILVPLIILYQMFPGSGLESQRDLLNAVFSFLLLPYPAPPVYGVAWTLVHEFLFTAVFTMVILVGTRGVGFLVAWAAGILVAHLAFSNLPFPISFFLAPSNFQFLIGIFVARAIKDRRIPAPALFLVCGLAVYMSFMLFGMHLTSDFFWERFIYGASAGAIIVGLVGMERRFPFHPPSWLVVLGAASFSIYLAHPVTLSATAQVLKRLPLQGVPVEIPVIILTVVGAVAGIVFHYLLEKPVTQIVQRWLDIVVRRRPVLAPRLDSAT